MKNETMMKFALKLLNTTRSGSRCLTLAMLPVLAGLGKLQADTHFAPATDGIVESVPAVEVVHPAMDQRMGYPAIITPGGVLPSLEIQSPSAGTLEGGLYNDESGALLQSIPPRTLAADAIETVNLTGALPPEGVYRIDLRMVEEDGNAAFFDSYYFSVLDTAALPANFSQIAHPGPNGQMRYIPDVRGNRVPDFSGVGYLGGADIPDLPTVLTVTPEPGDATQRIQDAIDTVSALEPDADGFRGAVELAAGLYEIADTLHIEQSGVVLRGAGAGPLQSFTLNPGQNLTLEQWRDTMAGTTQTILVATGPTHRQLLTIAGTSGIAIEEATSTEILDAYVPVGRRWFHVANPEYFTVGDTIQLERRGNADWISEIKMDQIPPRPDGGTITQWTPLSLFFEYTIRSIDGNRITIDSGLVNAVEQRWGGGRIRRYSEGGRIRQSGVENLRAVSFWQPDANGKDHTAHADRFVLLTRMRDGWARNIAAEHFTLNVAGMFQTGAGSLAITIENSSALAAPTSFYSGTGYDSSGRTHQATGVYVGRYGFHFRGQKGLVRNCFAINHRHAFVLASRVAGPNVFSDCQADQSLTYSEPHHRWSVGGLYDNVQESDAIALMNRLRYGSGHGWAGANFVAWNTRGGLICEQPPTAQNWAIGHVGARQNGPFHSWNLDNYGWSHGYWESHNQHVVPKSLYSQQLADLRSRSEIRLFDDSPATRVAVPKSTLMLDVFAEIGEDIPADDVTYEWQVLSGPGNPVFIHPTHPRTAVVFDVPGDYHVELIARSASPEVEERLALTLQLILPLPNIDTTGGSTEIVETAGQNYRVHTFSGVGSHGFDVLSGSGEIDVLVVAGGGGAGGSDTNRWGGAGGGGGGVIETTVQAAPGTYHIQVGDGGMGGLGATGNAETGEDSAFDSLIALGGGRGRGQNTPGDGGSGSGGAPLSSASFNNSGGQALQPTSPSGGYGHHGGMGTGAIGDDRAGGGGGGAGAAGSAASAARGGNGGAGHASAISGSLSFYGGGGGGAGRTAAGSGGTGGGGNGGLNANGQAGTPNTGGGGGASSLGTPHQGSKGGSGIVIVRVPIPSEQSQPPPSDTRIMIHWPHELNAPQLRWTPQADASYVLQTSDDLVVWRNANEVFHAGEVLAEIMHSLPATQTDRQFYRLVEIGQP